MKYIIPTRDWVEFLKARLTDVMDEGIIPKAELRYSNSVCTHIVRNILISRLRDLVLWYDDELELRLIDNTDDLLLSFDVESSESLIARIFPNFSTIVGVENPDPILNNWAEIIELEVMEPLDNFIQDHLTTTLTIEPSWHHATLKQMGNSYILNRGEDYRVLFWEKHRPDSIY